jgi:drug/metabolite transporter (DMT)-like permease
MTVKHKTLAGIIFCVVLWGFSFISTKIAVAVFPPVTVGAFRFGLALIFLFFIKARLAPGEKLRLKDVPLLAGAGLSGVTFYFCFENNGVALITASEASIITASIPVLTMTAEWLGFRLLRRRETGTKEGILRWIVAIISMGGVWLVTAASFSVSGAASSARGYLYMAGAALSWVVYCFLTRPLFRRCSRIHIVFWQTVFGFAGFLPFLIREYPRWGRPDIEVFLHILFLGVFCSALAYWIYALSLDILGIGVTAIFINLIPVVTVIAGFFILGERLKPLQWIGAVLVLSGVYLGSAQPARNPKTRSTAQHHQQQ